MYSPQFNPKEEAMSCKKGNQGLAENAPRLFGSRRIMIAPDDPGHLHQEII
jgi:hypothetical protein